MRVFREDVSRSGSASGRNGGGGTGALSLLWHAINPAVPTTATAGTLNSVLDANSATIELRIRMMLTTNRLHRIVAIAFEHGIAADNLVEFDPCDISTALVRL